MLNLNEKLFIGGGFLLTQTPSVWVQVAGLVIQIATLVINYLAKKKK
jgi:hypothetical protein